MSYTMRNFRVGTFTIVCEEEDVLFVDPLVHDTIVIEAINRNHFALTRVRARVLRNGVEVGSATLGDCGHPEVCEERGVVDMTRTSRMYRRKAVRRAIKNARATLDALLGGYPHSTTCARSRTPT